MSGYSGTPLAEKLGIADGFCVLTRNAPDHYVSLVEPLPGGVVVTDDATRAPFEMVHFFTNGRDELFRGLVELMKLIKPDGAIWVSWYKKAAKLPTEVTEDTVREACLPLGLVDIKVCAVDEKWSGLKLVIRKELRG